jgi:glutamyl/glutaminyl-tRNA synthetase
MTTNQKLQDTIKENILMLPKGSQEVINSFDWLGETDKVGNANNLTENKISDLQTEVALVLVGLTNPDWFAKNIEIEVGVSEEESKKIANEVLEKVFKPIADKIEQNIKNKVQDKKTNWDQNVNFTLSGGDYSVFAEKAGTTNVLTNPSNLPLSGEAKNPPVKGDTGGFGKSKSEDIRSKFTI